MPSITTVNRITMNSRTPSIEPGLQARVHDPLWMLARQYQMGEFFGEDAGSPVNVRMTMNVAPLSRYRAGDPPEPGARLAGEPFDPASQALEPLVEAETVQGGDDPNDRVGIETGLHLQRRLQREGLGGLIAPLRATFPFDDGVAAGAGDGARPGAPNDSRAERRLRLLRGRIADGRQVRAHLAAQGPVAIWTWPASLDVPPDQADALQRIATDWLAWYERYIDAPAPGPTAWQGAHQEYRFAVAAHDGAAETVLAATEHHRGRLDWDAFRARPGASLGASAADPGPRSTEAVVDAVPSQLEYPGMPASRWWEMEDREVDFGRVGAGRPDLVRLLFIDFALSYGNDWFLIPMEIPYGTLSRVGRFVVRDVFGVHSEIPSAARRQGWRMYTASGHDEGLMLPPVMADGFEGAPIEELRLMRGEMANLAWGIEARVEGSLGQPIDRHSSERVEAPAGAPPEADDGVLHYRLASTVPAHWVPFLPGRLEGTPVLERGEMLADEDAGGQSATRVLGRLLEPEREAFALFDETVPRAGLSITRRYRYARGADGEPHLWLGRHKTIARPAERQSGLRFDTLTHRPDVRSDNAGTTEPEEVLP